ncbi:ATP-binding protein [Sulfurimonas sp.]|uniref:sensor histidine kinase n=1 Tax=Sulfurimonas sp. TaxID=2022749 RepID=UPI0025E8A50C|nr:ATP-binding protein [Sulfurimonas sp.]
MKISSLFTNVTIRQANIFTILVIFFFTMIFVGLLVEEMYEEYEDALKQSYIYNTDSTSHTEVISQNHKRIKNIMIKTVLVIVTLSFIIFALFLGLNSLFSRLLNKDNQTFLDFFEQAVHNDKAISPKDIFFKDFKIMIGYANEMVGKINKQKNSLKTLNLELEDRVKDKTAILEQINQNLEKEKKFSQDLLKAQRDFLKYTVHETNTPLSVILTSIELYVMKYPKDRQLLKIEVAVKNIFSIYDDLSYLVKQDQVQYPKVVLNIENYLSSRIDFFTDVAELSRISFNYEPITKGAHIYFNETKLQRIVDNTITNAIKYTLPNEVVYIDLEQIGTFIELSIASKSKTIKDTDKVFDEYYRESRNRDGFGIGLRLVRTICDEEDIKISVSSDDNQTIFKYRFKMMGE